jgi:hypothetical protein
MNALKIAGGFFAVFILIGIVGAIALSSDDEAATPTVTQTSPRERARAPAEKPAPTPAKSTAMHFSGNGAKTLAAFTLEEDSTLYWVVARGRFQIVDNAKDAAAEPVNSQESQGRAVLRAGKHKLRMNAVGEWMVRIES